MRAWCALVVTLALASLGWPSSARAGEDLPALSARAEAAFRLNRYTEAAELYEKLYLLRPQSALLFDAAQSYRLAGQLRRALALYQSYLKTYGAQVDNRAVVEEHIATLTRMVAIEAQASTPAVAAGPSLQLSARPPPAAPSRRRWLWVGLGVAAALVVAAIVVGVVFATEGDPQGTLPAIRFGM